MTLGGMGKDQTVLRSVDNTFKARRGRAQFAQRGGF